MKKKLLSLIIAVCIFVLPLTVISFAGETEAILNDVFYIDVAEEYNIVCYSEEEEVTYQLEKNTDNIDFESEIIPYEYVYISVFENKDAISDVEKYQDELTGIFHYIVDEYLYLFDEVNFKSEITEINGYKCLKFTGVDDDTYYYNAYLLASEEKVYCLLTETDNKNSTFIKKAIDSFTINGTLLNGDSHKNTVDFTDAQNYKEQAESYSFGSGFQAFDEETNNAARIGMFMFMIPFIILVVVTVIMIVKYAKNKKILQQYEKTFGIMGMGMQPYMNSQMNYGAPMMNNSYMPNQPIQPPTQPMNQNYQAPTDNDGQNNNF
ncbi:MAG: hypothetical protein IJN49_02850 [Clostridia bacterium]|nr:hypothetical protein [Clostridia bacterium]